MKMAARKKKRSRERQLGYSMAELPASLWLLLIGLAFPLIIMISMSYRACFLYFASDIAAKKAAKSPTYTDAVANAAISLKGALKDLTGITPGAPVCSILVRPLSGGSLTEYKSKLAAGAVDTSKNLYFVRTAVDADLDPLVHFDPKWLSMSVPGLTGPYHLRFNIDTYSENPSGLTE